VTGGLGADTLNGAAGDDVLKGSAGDDLLDGGTNGPVLIVGGVGGDVASYSDATGDVTVSLAVSGAQAVGGGLGNDTLVNIEGLFGGAHNDTLTGAGSENFLYGGAGDDSLTGAGGDDALEGGAGDDALDGGSGLDTAVFSQATSGVTVDLNTVGAQAVGGGLGSDSLVSIEGVTGSGFGDSLTGTSATNWFDGGAGNDTIVGGAGNDTIIGGAGADQITAQAGAAEVTRITLGAGVDTLELDAAMAGTVVVTDFAAGAGGDVLAMEDYLTAALTGWNGTDNPFEEGFLQLVQDGTSTLLQINLDGAGDDFTTLVTLQNTSSLRLTAANLGYAPLPRVVGGTSGDTFTMAADDFVAGTPGNSIEVDGGGGVDVVELVTPAVVSGPATIQASADGLSLELDLDGDGIADLSISNVEDIVLNGEHVVVSGDLSRTGLAPNTITYMGTGLDNTFDASGLTSVESVHAEGLAGDDTLVGAGDDDVLDGGDGADSLVGGGGPDLLDGGAGDDTLSGGAGTDVAAFSGNHDAYTITDLGGGQIEVDGPDGTDLLTGVERLQFDDGGWGENHAPVGQNRAVTVTPNGSRVFAASDFGFSDPDGDQLAAVRIATVPSGGTLTDNGVAVTAGQVISLADIAAGRLVFTAGAQATLSFTFQVQDDGLVGWGVNLDATPNTLTLNVANPPPPPPSGPTVITSGTTGTAGNDVASFGGGADSFSAGAGADSVSGGAGADWLHGNAGADTLSGGVGDDVVYGGADNDQLSGDVGDDFLSGDLGADTLAGGDGRDLVFGGAGDDRIEGNGGESYLRGGEGADVVTGGDAFDDAHGNEGNDTVSGGGGDDWVVGGKDNDRLNGDDGGDIVYGNLGADTASGGAGDDLVRGGQDNDSVSGGIGADWLSGDRGDDTLSGGSGADTFHTFGEAGIDRVTDFSWTEGDRVQLDPETVYTVQQVGADTVIDMTGGGQMVLVGVQLATLPTGWIFEL
jgi:Ca2+-binding RTX toxin-like protein